MNALLATSLLVGAFSQGMLSGWMPKQFHAGTQYALQSVDGVLRLHARCQPGGAAGLVKQVQVDLQRTPWLSWSWQVAGRYTGLDERRKSGDDYPARLYVLWDGGWLRWRSRSVNYVWSSSQPRGSHWPNAYAGAQVRMVAVSAGAPGASMQTISRNVLADFKRFFGDGYTRVDAVAVMSDCDDARQAGEAWYGDIRFTAQPPVPEQARGVAADG